MSAAHYGAWWVWLIAAGLYLAFRLWYDNHRAALTPDEVEHFLRLAQSSAGAQHTDPATLRTFLEQDDGKEFIMCNLVRLHPHPVAHPITGALTEPRQLLQDYVKQFLVVLLARGGHPVMASRKVAGYLDAWNTAPNPGWSVAGMMRYRSRRDMMLLSTDARFLNAYPFKAAAVEQTFSLPTQVVTEMVLRPRGVVALVLALLAALVQLASLLVR